MAFVADAGSKGGNGAGPLTAYYDGVRFYLP